MWCYRNFFAKYRSKYMETFSYPMVYNIAETVIQVQIQTRQTPMVSKFTWKGKDVIQIPTEIFPQFA